MLDRLAFVLDSLGYRIQRSELCVELLLPLWCSVRVSLRDGKLELEPVCGFIDRSVVTFICHAVACFWASFFLLVIFAIPHLPGLDPLKYYSLVAFTGIFVVIGYFWEVCRYILTENAMSVVRRVYYTEFLMPSSKESQHAIW